MTERQSLSSSDVVDSMIDYDGAPVFVKYITAAERGQLLAGETAKIVEGQSSVEFDFAKNNQKMVKMVYFAACHADGSRFFDSEKATASIPAKHLEKLYQAASAHNSNDEAGEAGNA